MKKALKILSRGFYNAIRRGLVSYAIPIPKKGVPQKIWARILQATYRVEVGVDKNNRINIKASEVQDEQ